MTNDFGSLFQIGTGVGVIITGIWSRIEAKRAKEAAQGAKNQADQIRAAVQPNGESIHEILTILRERSDLFTELVRDSNDVVHQNSQLAEQNKILNKQANRLLLEIVRFERYTHRRNHTILNGLFRLALGNATLLRHFGIDVPDPLPPMPDEFRTPEQEGPLDELH